MSDFIALGLEAADKLIDHYFEKIPSAVFAPMESLHKIRKCRHNKHPELDLFEGRSESPGSPDSGRRKSDEDPELEGRDHDSYSDEEYDNHKESNRRDHKSAPLARDSTYSPSNPRSDPHYQEAQRDTRNGYKPPYEPPPPRDSHNSPIPAVNTHYPAKQRSLHATHSNVPYQYQHPASTSNNIYPASNSNTAPYDPYAPSAANYPKSSNTANHDPYAPTYPYQIYHPLSPSPPPAPRRSRSSHRYRSAQSRPPLRKRPSSTDGTFSTSDRGLGASSVGALAGGFLAQEIGERLRHGRGSGKGAHGHGHRHRHKHRHGEGKGKDIDPMALTLLGAALGGLGANLAESAYERRRREKDRERELDRDRDR